MSSELSICTTEFIVLISSFVTGFNSTSSGIHSLAVAKQTPIEDSSYITGIELFLDGGIGQI
jgi:hypothetical protein